MNQQYDVLGGVQACNAGKNLFLSAWCWQSLSGVQFCRA